MPAGVVPIRSGTSGRAKDQKSLRNSFFGRPATIAAATRTKPCIGTTNPSSSLYVASSHADSNISVWAPSNPSIRIADNNSNSAFFALSDTNGSYVNWGSNGNAGLIIGSSGAVMVAAGGPANGTGAVLTAGSSAWSTWSDRRLKRDIVPLSESLDRILNLNGYNYHYLSDASSSPLRVGLIAQEVESVLPEAVDKNEKGFLQVRYTEVIPLIVSAFKEFYQAWKTNQVAVHQELIEKDRQIRSLESENAAIKQDYALIKSYLCAKDPSAPVCK